MPNDNHAVDNVERDEHSEREGRGEQRNDRPVATTTPQRTRPRHKPLPPWNVLLHNDNENAFDFVIETIMMLTPLREEAAMTVTITAHLRGLSHVLTTHKERAELYQQQFTSRGLTVTIEPQ